MTIPLFRLGDEIDDYCPRCKLLLNHAVASMVGGTVVKVVCQTCHSEHPYKNAAVPPKKKSGPRAVLLDQVLAKVAPASSGPGYGGKNPGVRRSCGAPQKEKFRYSCPIYYPARHTASAWQALESPTFSYRIAPPPGRRLAR